MKKNYLSIALMVILVASAFEATAQKVVIGATIRPRFEVMYGYRVPPDTINDPQILVNQRTRLHAGYYSNRFNAYVCLQDARVWGDEVLTADVPSTGMHEAWFEYNFNEKFSLKGGRMEMYYDNMRLIGNTRWQQQSRSYDAAVLKVRLDKGWSIDAAVSYNQQAINLYNNFYSLNNYKTLDFVWVNKTKTDSNYSYSSSLLAMGDGYQTPDSTGVFMRYTYGANMFYNHHQWGVNAELFAQSGKTRAINQSGNVIPDSFQTVNAFMFSINPWIRVKGLQVGIGLDYLSGSDALDSTAAGTTNMFNPQYASNHRFYGLIDLFFNLPADTRNAGLVDGYLTFHYNYKKWDLNAAFHHYRLEDNVEDAENPGQALSKTLGSEINIWVIRDITKEVNINTGFATFFPTRSMEFVKTATFSNVGGPTVNAYWFYVMLTFTPVFFSSK